eukprot:gene10035-18672_t
MFHGATDDMKKSEITDSFADADGKYEFYVPLLVFSMGVDCKDLHFIIHYGPPTSIDDLCQEAGRAGRDGCQSHDLLLTYPGCMQS